MNRPGDDLCTHSIRWHLVLGLTVLTVTALGALALYVAAGTSWLNPLWLLTGTPEGGIADIILGLRGRRALLAFIVGGSLAVSGAGFQALLRNPLADPFVTGVSGGAAIGGTLVMVFLGSSVFVGIKVGGASLVFVGAFLGATGVAILLSRLASTRGVLNTQSLLLMGVVFNFFASAVVLFLKAVIQGTKLQEILFWLMGSLAAESVGDWLLWSSGLAVCGGVFALFRISRHLNLITLGEEAGHGAGVNPERLKWTLFLVSSVLVAISVSLAGFVGFVGLVVPHMVRLAVGADHRLLVPFSALSGGIFLLLTDLVARLSFPFMGTQLPVGVITAFVGGPWFIAMLVRSQRTGRMS